MTPQQLQHFIEGGKFRAVYNPTKVSDLSSDAQSQIGSEIIVYQNMEIAPRLVEPYKGQHQFNSPSIHGWIPEEDLEELTIIEDYISHKESLPAYIYLLHYETWEQITGNFGRRHSIKELPFTAQRTYANENDGYVLHLSTPQASKIEKAIYKGVDEDISFETIFN